MFYFLILLSFISGLILISKKSFFIGLTLLLIIIFIFIKKIGKNYKKLIILLVFFLLGIILSFVKYINISQNIGLVIYSKNNYLIIQTVFNRYYINSKENIPLFSLIKVDGNISDFNFSSLESSFSFNDYLNNKGVFKQIYQKNIDIIIKSPFNFSSIKEKYLDKFDKNNSILVNAILFKEVDYSSNFIYKVQALNILHLFSLSGIYLSFILYGLNNLLSKIINKKVAYILAFILLLPLIIINLNQFIVFRIVLFYILRGIFKLKNLNFDKFKINNLFCLSCLLINRFLIYSYTFIIYLLISNLFNFLKLYLSNFKRIKQKIVSSVIIYFILVPFSITFSNTLNLITPLISLILLPITKLTFLILLIGFYGIYFPFYNNLITYLLKFIDILKFDKLNINIPSLNQYLFVLYYLILIIIFYFLEINYKKKVLIYSSILTISLAIYCVPIDNYLFSKVTFINVGQGDSTYINYKNKSILIDTGGLTYQDLAKNSLIPFLKKNRVYKLDAVFITHTDFDHSGALDSLKSNFKVLATYTYNSSFPINIGELQFNNLNIYNKLWEDENSKSLVIKLKIKDKIFLFMGDATKNIEKKLVEENIDIKCDYLKVGHHGSNTSSLDEFIKKSSPKEAIISCGYNNKYKHPHKETLETLEKYKVTIRRTDLEGSISYLF